MTIGIADKIRVSLLQANAMLKGGQMQFLADCTHALRGQTLPLLDIPERALRYAVIER